MNRSFRATSIVLVVFAVLVACDNDPMRNGARALYSGHYQEAEQRFKEALARDQSNLEAKRRLADVALNQGKFTDAEQILHEIQEEIPQDDRNDTLTIEQKVTQNLLTKQFTQLYVSWVQTIDGNESSDLAKHIFTEGIRYAPADPILNSAATRYYVTIGDKFVDEGKEQLAIESYRSAMNYSMPQETKHDIEGKIAKSQRISFDKAFARHLSQAKEELTAPFSWNEEEGVMQITLDYPLDWRRARESDLETIRREATPLIESSIRTLMASITTLPSELRPEDLFIPKYRVAKTEKHRRGAIIEILVKPEEIASATFLSVAKFGQDELQRPTPPQTDSPPESADEQTPPNSPEET